jgi:hypothetical protein
MSPPQPRNGGPGHHPEAPAATQKISAPITKHDPQKDRTATTQVLVAFATRFLAAGDTTLDWVVVRKCPLCGHAHKHILFEIGASTIERAPACARHRSYLVTVTDVVPSAAERRRSAA